MLELTNLKGNTWAVLSPVNVGVCVKDGEVALIDTGASPDAGRRVLKLVKEKGWSVKWIVNTHCHADHIGGNHFIQKRTECGLAASPLEAACIEHTAFETNWLWSAAAPRVIRTNFMEAEPSQVTKLLSPGEELEGWGLRAVDLSGHSHGQIGLTTPDGVFFTGDAVIAPRVLAKYGIPFVADSVKMLDTFDRLEAMAADLFVPSHGEVCTDVRPLVQVNRECVLKLRAELLSICEKPRTRDEIVAALAQSHNISIDLGQYVLTESAASALITPLLDEGLLAADFSGGTLRLARAETVERQPSGTDKN